jgi:DNA-binding MarR family transcriptional regulator
MDRQRNRQVSKQTLNGSLPALDAPLEFLRLIWEIDHSLHQTSKRMERRLGVTGPQRFAIRIVGRFPGIPASQIAKLLHVHAGTLTGILRRLQRKGLIRRQPDPRDGRRLLLRLTDRGKQFDIETEGTVEAAVRQTLEGAPRAKIRAAREILALIAQSLTNNSANPS